MDERWEEVEKIWNHITNLLPTIDEVDGELKKAKFMTSRDRSEILSTDENEVETIANLFDQLYGEGTMVTGYYDPVEDERNGEVDNHTGFYYVTID